jgi:hypothetical protein
MSPKVSQGFIDSAEKLVLEKDQTMMPIEKIRSDTHKNETDRRTKEHKSREQRANKI